MLHVQQQPELTLHGTLELEGPFRAVLSLTEMKNLYTATSVRTLIWASLKKGYDLGRGSVLPLRPTYSVVLTALLEAGTRSSFEEKPVWYLWCPP